MGDEVLYLPLRALTTWASINVPTVDLLFDWAGFDQASKTIVH